MEPRWIRVTRVESIPVREGRAVQIVGREIAIFNLGDGFLATDNRCPHSGGPLCDGIVTGHSVVCPLHAWKVNLCTGIVERPTAGKDRSVRTYPTRIEDGIVLIGLPRNEAVTQTLAIGSILSSPADDSTQLSLVPPLFHPD